jgi:hypothetical protein
LEIDCNIKILKILKMLKSAVVAVSGPGEVHIKRDDETEEQP